MLKIIQVLTLTNSLTVQAKIFKQFYSHKTMHKNQMRKLPQFNYLRTVNIEGGGGGEIFIHFLIDHKSYRQLKKNQLAMV